MSEKNVGGIFWTVDADTKGATTSIRQMEKQTNKTEKSLVKLDAQTKKTTKAVNKGLAGMGRASGQAGIQFQQFIGQVQGGQSAMLALSQQSADLGFVLGAPLVGAIVGISASIAGMLLPNLLNGKTATEELEKALEALKGLTYETSEGTIVLGDAIEKLAKKSKSAARVELALGIIKAKEALKAATKQADEASKTWEGFFQNISNALLEVDNAASIAKKTGESQIEVIKRLGDTYEGAVLEISQLATAVEMVAKEYGVSETQALGFLKAVKQFRESGKTSASMQVLAASISSVALSVKKPKKELLELAGKINEASVSSTNASDVIKLFEFALKDFEGALKSTSKTSSEYKNKVDSMIESLEMQAATFGKNNREIALHAAKLNKATEAQVKAINAIFDDIEAKEKQVKAQKEIDAQMDKSFASGLARELKAKKARALEDKKAKQARALEDKKAASTKQGAIKFAEVAIASGKSPIERLEEEQAQLLLLKEKYVDQSALFDEALTANSKKQADLRSAYQIANANLILSASSNLFGGLASLLKSSGDEQSNAYKAMFALSKGFAVAQAAMNLSLAISNASAITPWYASLPAVASVVSAGAGLASSIAGATYSGRENGGSVVNGQTYEVGEKNKPEMLMIPGNNGKVFSNAEMKSAMGGGNGGGGVEVNLYGAPEGTRVESRQDPLTGKQVIDMIVDQMGDPNSKGRRVQQSNSNLSGVLNGQRRR